MVVDESLVVSTQFTEYGMPSVVPPELTKPLLPPLHLFGLPNAIILTLLVNDKAPRNI